LSDRNSIDVMLENLMLNSRVRSLSDKKENK
jgi:hypothetical protein